MKTSLICVWVLALMVLGVTGCNKKQEQPPNKVPAKIEQPAKVKEAAKKEASKATKAAKAEHPSSEHPK